MTYHQVCNWSNMTGGTSEAVTAYSYGGSEFILCFNSGSFCLIFNLLCSVLLMVLCPFVLLLAIVVSVLL